MKNVLIINSSLNGEQGNSNKLTQTLVDTLKQTNDINIVERDLAAQPLAHLSQQEMAAWMTEESERSPEQQALAVVSDELIAELQASDVIVFGVPMYNFGIPSTLKAWIDRIARAGITFKYTEQGPVGLVENKKAIVLAARGGVYVGTDMDTQTKYLQDVLGFIGVTNVEFIYAEGLAMPDAEQSLSNATESVIELAKTL